MSLILTISQGAAVKRINRALAREEYRWLRVRKTRPPAISDLGDYYLLDLNRNAIVDHHLDLTDLAKEHKVLGQLEAIS